MAKKIKFSRRQFVASAMSVAAFASLPSRRIFAGVNAAMAPSPQGASSLADNPTFKDQGVENLVKSPYAKLRNIPVHVVTIQSGFWSQRREINFTKSIPTMHDLLEANGRMNNFRRLVGKSSAPQHGPVFSDSDVYKWTEAVGFALQSGDLPDLKAKTEKLIDEVVAVQEPSGYLNTYFVEDREAAARCSRRPKRRGTSCTTSDTCSRARSLTTAAPATASCWMREFGLWTTS